MKTILLDAVLIIRARGNSLALLRPHAAACLLALESIQLGETIEVGGSVER